MSMHDQIRLLTGYAAALRARIANPRTCPRLAVEAEAELADTLSQIADIRAKILATTTRKP